MAKLKTGRHTSSLKEVRKAAKRRWANVSAKSAARDLAKQLTGAIAAKDAAKVKELLPKTMSAWKKLGNAHTVHPSNASRKIAKLSRAAHKALSAA
ncbi:MAG TPA: 30S ribosomal protein S20 [Elusimicrobiota bacterium]|jgi:small subunit ribosomal protein S20|nr:30S ribosomal protein S20 [Elusimicrobiota bacterium]HMX93975.1 30S ribosomal protein S20 [Elusimicrobiota bacterium]HMZ26258.1 30S ribosomal protein S20 [Elusimicrobiota bacterium]HNA60990.1 30S ribosomal protein S20 [Elusimicrobiota bacterium]HNF57962.1 30S ribosomal protein S20 [Elusimicrobiota bacterium]